MEYEKLLIAARYQPTTVGNMLLDPNGGYCNYQAVEILRQRVAELEKERDAALAEVALLKPNPLCDTGCMLSCKMEADYYEKQIIIMKSELREALACGEDGDWQSARRIINTALGEDK